MLLMVSSFIQLFSAFEVQPSFIENIKLLYSDGVNLLGGGVFGGLLTLGLTNILGSVGTGILYGAICLICAVILFNISLIQLFVSVKNAIIKKIAKMKEEKAAAEKAIEEKEEKIKKKKDRKEQTDN